VPCKILLELHHEQNEMTWETFMEVDENGNFPYRDYKLLTASEDSIKRKGIETDILFATNLTKRTKFRKDGMTLAQIMGIPKEAQF
jgi:C-terminal processing protease CtpA/Prc